MYTSIGVTARKLHKNINYLATWLKNDNRLRRHTKRAHETALGEALLQGMIHMRGCNQVKRLHVASLHSKTNSRVAWDLERKKNSVMDHN